MFKINRANKSFILLILMTALLLIWHRYDAVNSPNGVINRMTSTLWHYAVMPQRWVSSTKSHWQTKKQLIRDNQLLRLRQQILQAKIHKLLVLQKQNQQLRQLLSSSSDVGGDFIVAQLLAVLKNPVFTQAAINQGHSSQVYAGQPVLDGFGVVGQVVSTMQSVSKIQFITDAHSVVPVQVLKTGVRAVVVGQGAKALLKLKDILKPERLKVGQLLVTSGLGLQYPVGYPVGVIEKISFDSMRVRWNILVRPAAHLDVSTQFLLVWPAQSRWRKSAEKILQSPSQVQTFAKRKSG